MGFLQINYGMEIVGEPPEGTCPTCGFVHIPEMPHQYYSIYYHYKFYDLYGRWPSWADAMAHCPPGIKAFWRKMLEDRGVEVGEEAAE